MSNSDNIKILSYGKGPYSERKNLVDVNFSYDPVNGAFLGIATRSDAASSAVIGFNVLDEDLLLVKDPATAGYVADYLLNYDKYTETRIRFETIDFSGISKGSVITISHTEIGIFNELFRVVEITRGDFLATIEAVSYSDSIFSNAAPSTTTEIGIDPFLPGIVPVVPADVTGVQAIQNGNAIIVTWAAPTDGKPVSYEIREGIDFATSQLWAEFVAGLTYSAEVSTERTYTFWLRAISIGGLYSANPASGSVVVSNISAANVILTYDEMALQSGTHSNTEFRQSNLRMSDIPGRASDYPGTKWSAFGAGFALTLIDAGDPLSGTYTCVQKDAGKVITAGIVCEFNSFALGTGGSTCTLEFRSSSNGVTWSGWATFQACTLTFRYLEFRVQITRTVATAKPEVVLLAEKIDVPDVIKSGGPTAIAVGGSAVSFGFTHYIAPSVVASAIGSGVVAEIVPASVTTTQFQARVLDSSGVDVGGNIFWISRGY